MTPLRRATMMAACLCLAMSVPWVASAPEEKGAARPSPPDEPLPTGAVTRLGTARMRHGDFIGDVAFSPDGKTLASCGADGRVVLCDLATGKELRELLLPKLRLKTVLFSGDGKHLFVGASALDGKIRVLEADTGREVRQIAGHRSYVSSLALSPNGKLLVSTGGETIIRVWETATGKEVRQVKGPKGIVSCVAFCPDGKHFASSGQDNFACLWEADTGKEVRRFVPTGPVSSDSQVPRINNLVFSPDGKTLAGTVANRGLAFWDVATGKELRGIPDPVRALAFSPDGKYLAAGYGDRTLRLIGVASGRELRRWDAHEGAVHAVAFSADGKTLASAGQDRVVRLWDAPANRELHPRAGHTGAILALAFTPDGRRLVTGSMDHTVRVWETATAKELDRLEEHQLPSASPALAADGQVVFLSGTGRSVYRWRPGGGKETIPLEGQPGGVQQALTPDGKTLASAGTDMVIRLHNPSTGQQERELKGHQASITGLLFSPDGKVLASTSGDGTLRLWDPATGTEVRVLGGAVPGGPRRPFGALLAFAPDSRSFVTADTELRVWEVLTGRERARFPSSATPTPTSPAFLRNYYAAAFSPDGRMLVVGTPEGALRILDLAAGKEAARIPAHRGAARPVDFSPDGKALATGGGDGTVLLWDPAALAKHLPRREAGLAAGDLDRLWAGLGSDDTAQGFRVVCSLAADPGQAVPFLKDRLRGGGGSDPERVARLIAQLDDNAFAVREQASKELANLGAEVVPALKKALEGPASAEAKRRIEELLEKHKEGVVPVSKVRALRAVEALEYVGTPEARQVLEALAKTSKEAWLTEAAKAAVERLKVRSAARP